MTCSTQLIASRETTVGAGGSTIETVESSNTNPPSSGLSLPLTVSGFSAGSGSGAGGPSGSRKGGRVLVNSAPGRCLWKT